MAKVLLMNNGNLKDEEVNEKKFKSRIIIINNENKILLQNYAGVYMLPGGKIDIGETTTSGLIREIKEETGIDFKEKDIMYLMKTKMYVRNYPRRNSSVTVNKLVETDYFYIKSNERVKKNEAKYTPNEKTNKLTMEFVDFNEAIKLVQCNNSSNPRKQYYDEELLEVLKYFKEVYIQRNKENNNIIDMHIHTCYSDGDFKPEEIVEKVEKAGINVFSITDHDTILGCKKLENFKQAGLTYIPGIELTASVPKGRMHILGYNLDINNKKLLDLLKRKRENSINSMEIMYRYVHDKYGVNIPQYEFDILKKKIGNIGRPDLALLLRKYGYAMDNDQAFKKYLVEAFDATYTNRVTTSKEECIAVLKDAGAYISLAHPISLKMEYEELKSELEYLKVLGLDAIEISHSNQPEEYRNILRYLRDELKLYETGGSDFHGPTVQPDIELGTGRGNNIKIKQLSLIDKIKS